MAEIVKAAKNLIDAALYFSTLNPSNSPRNIPAAVRCLVSALSLVIPTSLELEIRLMLGELLLSYGEDVTLGLDQFQKAYSLTQTFDCPRHTKFRIQSGLISAFIKTGSLQLADNILQGAFKETTQMKEWDWYIHFILFQLKTQGFKNVISLDSVVNNLPEELKMFAHLLVCLVSFCQNPIPLPIEQLLSLEAKLTSEISLGLKALILMVSLAQRLLFSLTKNNKELAQISNLIMKELSNLNNIELPGFLVINSTKVQEHLNIMMTFLSIKCSLIESETFQLVQKASKKDIKLKDFAALASFEILLLQLKNTSIEEENVDTLNPLDLLNLSIARGSLTRNENENILSSHLASNAQVSQRLKLMQVQNECRLNPMSARLMLAKFKDRITFVPTAYYYLLEATISIQCHEAVHISKEYLLAALKIVNGPNQRDDIIKACVLLLLAQIYQETDFGLAEKMSSTAYELYRNLGNDRLALAAGNILARLFDIQGAVEKAKQQIAANDKHEEAMGSG